MLDSCKIGEDSALHIDFPSDMSVREAKQLLYARFQMQLRILDGIVYKAVREDLRGRTRKSEFINKIVSAHNIQGAGWGALDLDLEDDELDIRGVSERELTVRASSLYKKTIDQIATKVLIEKETISKAEKQRTTLLKELVAKPAKVRLQELVDQRIAVAKSTAPKKINAYDPVAAYIAADDGTLDADHANEFINVRAPGATPSKGGGGRGKGKGKGKGKDKAKKTKGKGKGKGITNRGANGTAQEQTTTPQTNRWKDSQWQNQSAQSGWSTQNKNRSADVKDKGKGKGKSWKSPKGKGKGKGKSKQSGKGGWKTNQ